MIIFEGSGGLLLVLFVWLLFGGIFGVWASEIWKVKGGSPTAGFFLGFLLGVVGIVIAYVGTPTTASLASSPGGAAVPAQLRQCPACKEAMKRDASICPHCRTQSRPWIFSDGYWWATDGEGDLVYLEEASLTWRRLPSGPPTPFGGQTGASGHNAPNP